MNTLESLPQVDGEAISDAAVEAAISAHDEHMFGPENGVTPWRQKRAMKLALTAALPHLSAPSQQSQVDTGGDLDGLISSLAPKALAAFNAALVPSARIPVSITMHIAMCDAIESVAKELSAPLPPQGAAVAGWHPAGCTLVDNFELATLRERAALPLRIGADELWHWQGDGQDFPESLSCPVVMTADSLRALLKAATPQPAAPAVEPCAMARAVTEAINGVLIAGATGNLEILTRNVNTLIDAARKLAATSVAAPAQVAGSEDHASHVYVPAYHGDNSPYFECTKEQWARHTQGMTDHGVRVLANMVAHHYLLARRDDLGWLITRSDLIKAGKPFRHVSNDGVSTIDYDPETKAKRAAAQPAPSAGGTP